MTSNSWHEFRQKASTQPQRLVFAEGEDPRVVKAARILHRDKIAFPELIGSRRTIENLWKKEGGREDDLQCLDPQMFSDAEKQSWAETWLSIPKNKSQSIAEARQKIQDPLVLGCLYLKRGKVDGFIGGAVRTTADTLRAVFTVIGLAPHAGTLFGFFLIENRSAAEAGSLILLGDCAVIPEPSAKQLSNIAVGSAAAYQFFTGGTPRVAFLSFSTLGSAEHPLVEKIQLALKMAREKAADVMFEGEWQADAALDVFTAGIKGAGSSPMAGRANVLIAPDLNCGNIAYKLTQRLGQVRAVGPVLWGTAQPANDLSRGCSVEDIVDMAALTAIQAQKTPRQPAFAQREIKQ